MRKLTQIYVNGRRWFQRTYGNTYCTAVAFAHYDNGDVERVNVPRQYGYGDFYIQAAADALEAAGHMPNREHYPNGGAEMLWRYCSERGIRFDYDVADVTRQRDLHDFK